MIYEGTIEVSKSSVNIQLNPTQSQGSEYSIQFDNTDPMLSKSMTALHPFFDPDEEAMETNEYISKLKKIGYGSFYSDSQNIHDLVNLYTNTEPANLNPFPGITTTRKSNEIVFIETIKKFKGRVNEQTLHNKTVQFIYRGVM